MSRIVVPVGSKEIPMVTPRRDVTVTNRKPGGKYSLSNFFAPTLDSASAGPGTVLSADKLTATLSSGSTVINSIGRATGKWYCEFKVTVLNQNTWPAFIGLVSKGYRKTYPAVGPDSWIFYGRPSPTQLICASGTNSRTGYARTLVAGDVVGIAFDADARQVIFYLNGVSQGVAFTSTLVPAGTYFPMASAPEDFNQPTTGTPVSVKYGGVAGNLFYPCPSGYTPWNTLA